jgi:hypothetical protein
LPGASLRPGSLAFNPRPRRLSTPLLTPFNSTPISSLVWTITLISAASWLADVVGANARVRKLADAIYANDFGCSLHKMGMHESVIEKKAWKYGEQYLVLDRSLSHVAAALAEGVDVRLGWMAKCVERGDGGDGGDDAVVVRSRDGAHVINARKVVIAVPITALKGGRARGGTGGDGGGGGGGDDDDAESSNAIVFDPPLPPLKANAANAVSMSNAVKVFIGFDEMFWPADLFDVVCVDCYLPELWVLTYPPEERTAGGVRFEGGDGGDDDVARRTRAVVTFFVAGDLADEVTRTPKETVIERALDQLDTMFGTVADPKPSRRRMTGAHVHDWSAETTVLGAYTHPTLDAAGARQVLAAPVGDWLFFAGEATHVGVNPCMQGAMETGVRAAAQVMASARPGATSKM